ncbi:MAG: TIGR03986 family CRISPR-associated RAMP protein [Geitlerinemataceae cyanobacterium]
MNPKHIDRVPNDRRAVAPYNFVELPDRVVEAEELPSNDRYDLDRHTGKIECTLTTESLLYTRCGWSPEDFAEQGEEAFNDLSQDVKDKRSNFFINPATHKPIVPGSSLRGMLRSLVEIVSFGKIDRVSDQQHFFFRAVAADREDPLKEEYKKYIKPENIKAGYLVEKNDRWFIRPAMLVDGNSFVWVKKDRLRSIPDSIPMSNLSDYRPQYFTNISFEDIFSKNSRHFARKVSKNCTKYQYIGVIVTSGNMLEGGTNPRDLKRQNHCIIREPDPKAELIPISQDAIRDYCSALTAFQKQKPPFDERQGVLKNDRSIFYCQPQTGESIALFGQSPNFRIPYSPQGNGKASTARDFIPEGLKDSPDRSALTDIAEAIFGFVRRDKQSDETGKSQSRVGRVSIADAILKPNQEEKIQQSLDREPKPILLSSPEPTTFQHYLVQKEASKKNLKHYASQPPTEIEPGETVIRGHKLYWHKPAQIEVPSDASDTQTSLIKPIDSGIEFTFTIHFENLSKVELGALLWVLSLSSDKSQTLGTGKPGEKYCFSLGMGKPLGMGAVKIDYELYLSDRISRYQNLFETDSWKTSDIIATLQKEREYVKEFETFICDRISTNDLPHQSKVNSLQELPRIEMLLAILRYDRLIDTEQTRYLTIEPENEYNDRSVLPTPLQIAGIEDRRQCNPLISPVQKNQENVVKSERQLEIDRTLKSQTFEIGQILEAKVISTKGNKVTYQLLETLKLTQKEPKKASILEEGKTVQVKIMSLKEDGNIKSVKCLD